MHVRLAYRWCCGVPGPSLSRLEEMADSVRRANHLLRPSNKGLMQQQEGVRLTDLYGHRELEPPKIR